MNQIRKVVLLVLSAMATGCAGDPIDNKARVPNIVEVFACSDYCPGPEERYIKQVYEGVTDKNECLELGGRPYSYVGWGERTVCEVK
jgi:hypothetical protein